MNSLFKITLIVSGILVAAVIGLFVLVYSSLDKIVEDAVVEYGRKYTGAPVTLNKLSMIPKTGNATLEGLFVGSPKDSDETKVLHVPFISVNMDLSNLKKQEILVNSIVIHNPEITYQPCRDLTNLKLIQNNVEKAMLAEALLYANGGTGRLKTIAIKELVIKHARILLKNPQKNKFRTVSLLPVIKITNIGTGKKGGSTPALIIKEILDKLEQHAVTLQHRNSLEEWNQETTAS